MAAFAAGVEGEGEGEGVMAAGVDGSADVMSEVMGSCSCNVCSGSALTPTSCCGGAMGSDMLAPDAENCRPGSCGGFRAIHGL